MVHPPPKQPLFPYTTLFRSLPLALQPASTRSRRQSVRRHRQARARSEEHTSELQSLAYLVCRLLLEKKNVSIIYSLTAYLSLTLDRCLYITVFSSHVD